MRPTLHAELVLDSQARVAECPLWHPLEQALYWVDIDGKTINRFDPITRSNRSWPTITEPGCIALRKTGGFVVACRDGFYEFDARTGLGERIAAAPYDTSQMRFNDGKCDALGRFWVGAMFEPRTEAIASMYVLNKGEVQLGWGHAQGLGVKVSNGLAFDDKRGFAYQSDTSNHVAYRFEFDLATAHVSNRQVFFIRAADKTKADYAGRPDGAALDIDGNYWSAQYEGGCVVCYSPAGEILQSVTVPAKRTTMVVFGGADFKTLYITTAREGATADELAAYPHSGGIFAVRLGPDDVGGKPEPFYID